MKDLECDTPARASKRTKGGPSPCIRPGACLFEEALAQWCSEDPVREKWLIASSLRVGHQWLDSVAMRGQPVLNCRVKTFKGMALELAAADMARQGLTLISGTGALMLMDAILHGLPESGYLSRLPSSTGFARVVLASINALRVAGVGPENLVPSFFDEPTKAEDMRYLVNRYMQELAQRNLVDYAGVLPMAIRHASESLMSRRVILIPEDADLTALELALVKSMPETAVHWLPVDQPARTAAEAKGDETDAGLLRWLSAPTDAPEPRRDGTAAVFHASGAINEVREILRRCIKAGHCLDEVELLHTDKQTYVPLIFETIVRLSINTQEHPADLPVTFAEGIPAMYAKPGRALAAWVQWINEDYTQKTLVSMIGEGLLRIPGLQEAGVSPLRLAGILRDLPIGWGKDRYIPKIDENLHALDNTSVSDVPFQTTVHADADADEPAMRSYLSDNDRSPCLRVIRELVDRMLHLTPTAETTPVQALQCAATFVSSLARADNEMDQYAAKALAENIRDMAEWLGKIHGPVSLDVWEWLRALPSNVWIMGRGPRPGTLHVAHVKSGGFSSRKHTFIMGLDDGRFPGTALNDPMLLDSEREKLSPHLPTTRQQLGKSMEGFVRLLARLRGTVTLSFPSSDLNTDRALFPSPVIFSTFRILSGNRSGDQSDLMQWLSLPASFAPAEEALHVDETEWWLWRLCGRERVRKPLARVYRRFPHLARGRMASDERSSDRFTVYDGYIGELPQDLDPFASSGPIMSSAMLETIGACALRYFFRHILEIRPREQRELDVTRWLDPVQFGNLLHDVFYRFMSELISQRRVPLFERDMGRLTAILEQCIDRYARIFPPPGPSVFRQQRMQLLQSARIFLTEEEVLCRTRNPRFLEVSVGSISRGNTGPIDTREPVSLTLDDRRVINVRGRIDRIDTIGDEARGAFVVCDYKTGSEYRYTKPDPFWEGRVIQHALYLAIAANVLKRKVTRDAKVVHFEYYFPQYRSRGRRIRISNEHVQYGTAIITNLCRLVSGGCFLPTINDKDDCHSCEYVSACGDVKSNAAYARLKMANPENTKLEPLRGLRNGGNIET